MNIWENKKKTLLGSLKAITMVVRDLDSVVHAYADVLGIGPWKVYKFNKGKCKMLFPDRKTVSRNFILASCTRPEVELRLIQPAEGTEDVFSQFLVSHGNGIHHIAFAQNSKGINKAVEIFNKLGDSALCKIILEGEEFLLMNAMRSMGYNILLEDENISFDVPAVTFPSDGLFSDSGLIKRIRQVCCGIDEIQSRIQHCADNLGMTPWVCVHLTEECLTNIETGSTDPGNDFDCGLYDGFPVQIEYTAPRVGGNFHSDYLAKHGVQLHHIAVETDNYRKIVSRMTEIGEKLLCANYVDSTEISVFIDTRKTLGCFLQVCEKCSGKGGKITEVTTYPPENS
ncbi:MAG: VOC family protein [Treponema sp.]|jgi:hypothetical protein|nr:VOC family protein [Treponema sp.]